MLPDQYLGLFRDIFWVNFTLPFQQGMTYSIISHHIMCKDKGVLHSPGMQPLHGDAVSLFLM